MNKIQEIIVDTMNEWNMSPSEINNRNCDIFADEIISRLRKENISAEYKEILFEHCFIKVKDKYYDAECPEGVKNYKELPFFKEKFKRAKLLWEYFGDIPINEQEEIDDVFLHFPKGTPREDIWHWFEEEFDLSVAEDLIYHIRD